MYAHVVNNQVRAVFPKLPHHFAGERLGTTTPPAKLTQLGLLPVVDVTPAANATHTLTGHWSYTVFPDRVEAARAAVPLVLEEAKKLKLQQIALRYDQDLAAGVAFAGHTWPTDNAGRDLLTGVATLLLAGNSLPPEFVWRNTAGVAVGLSAQEVGGLLRAMIVAQFRAREKAFGNRALVAAAVTVAAVAQIVA